MSNKRFIDCTNKSVDNFDQYDRNVDIVTCWESFAQAYHRDFPDFHFDRFPSYKSGDDRWKNPCFTMHFDSRYGIAFEVYHRDSVAKIDRRLENELDKIASLDNDLKIENRNRRLTRPKALDLCLIVDSSMAQTLAHKIAGKIDMGELSLSSNLILIEFDFIEGETSKYRFRRVTPPDQNFRDDIIPQQGRISEKLSPKGGNFENIQVATNEDFAELKTTGMFTNRQTSELYLACRLWDTVLNDKLSDDQRAVWKKEDPNKIIELDVSCQTLRDNINNNYAPGGNVAAEDVKSALRFIAIAKRAVQIDDDMFRVKYSNLREKRRSHKDTVTERSDIGDLAYLLSEWHCQTKVDNSLKELADIVTVESYNTADLSDISGSEAINF